MLRSSQFIGRNIINAAAVFLSHSPEIEIKNPAEMYARIEAVSHHLFQPAQDGNGVNFVLKMVVRLLLGRAINEFSLLEVKQ